MLTSIVLSPETEGSDDGDSVMLAGTISSTVGGTVGDEGSRLVETVGSTGGGVPDDGQLVGGVDAVIATGLDVESLTSDGNGVPAAGFIEGARADTGMVGLGDGGSAGRGNFGTAMDKTQCRRQYNKFSLDVNNEVDAQGAVIEVLPMALGINSPIDN